MHKNSEQKHPEDTHSQLERQHNTQKGLLLPSFLPEGGTQQTFIREGSAPRFNLWYLFIYHFSRKSYPFCIPSIDKWYPFHMNILCLELCIPFNCCKCTFFKIGINISQNRKFSRLYKAMKFIFSPFGSFHRPNPIVYLKPEKGAPIGRSLPV